MKCGIGDYTYNLALSLSTSIKVSILTFPHLNSKTYEQLNNNLEIYRVLKRSGENISNSVKSIKPDIIHYQNNTYLYSQLFNCRFRTIRTYPIILTVHDTPISWRSLHVLPFLRLIYSISDKIFVHTENIRQKLIYFHKISPKRILKIPHGIDTCRFHPDIDTSHFIEKYHLQDKFILMQLGFIRPGKNLEFTIHLFKELIGEYPHFSLVLAGGIPTMQKRYFFGLKSEVKYFQQIRKLIGKLRLQNKVIFTGYLNADELPVCINSPNLLLFPYPVTQSGVMHMALACGKIIIGLKEGGAKEVITSNINGILVEKSISKFKEKIIEIYQNKEFQKKLEQKARLSAEKLSWTHISKKTIIEYKKLLNRNLYS
ncbi:MAG: glycosyltransferase family 4 protein [Candidatus Helarchaeota archaeon]